MGALSQQQQVEPDALTALMIDVTPISWGEVLARLRVNIEEEPWAVEIDSAGKRSNALLIDISMRGGVTTLYFHGREDEVTINTWRSDVDWPVTFSGKLFPAGTILFEVDGVSYIIPPRS